MAKRTHTIDMNLLYVHTVYHTHTQVYSDLHTLHVKQQKLTGNVTDYKDGYIITCQLQHSHNIVHSVCMEDSTLLRSTDYMYMYIVASNLTQMCRYGDLGYVNTNS